MLNGGNVTMTRRILGRRLFSHRLSYKRFSRRWLMAIALFVTVVLTLSASAPLMTQGLDGIEPLKNILDLNAGTPLGSKFTYQGQLKQHGNPFGGTCSMQFSLWDASGGGSQLGSTQTINSVQVNGGSFTVVLDFGSQFDGSERWLQTAVKCGADAAYTTLSPRSTLTPVPYALSLRPGALIDNQSTGSRASIATSFSGLIHGLRGETGAGAGVVGIARDTTGATYGILGNAHSPDGYAVWGYATNGGAGVRGVAIGGGRAVWGSSDTGAGVMGTSQTWHAVDGRGQEQVGVYGESQSFDGVWGVANAGGKAGVVGQGKGSSGVGVLGNSTSTAAGSNGAGVRGVGVGSNQGVYGSAEGSVGVKGTSQTWHGVDGRSQDQVGVYGESQYFDGTWGVANSTGKAGVVGIARGANGIGVLGQATGAGGYAAVFEGAARTNVLEIIGGADLAELFQASGDGLVEPGTLVIVDQANPGQVKPSEQAYDTRVIGIVSGAGGVQPGLTLHQEGLVEGDTSVAIAGRVYVKAEADSAPIQPGDLLTSSGIPGHVMKASDRDQAYGAVIGKALTGLDQGSGLVLVLVNLQ
jgi:hypothetical protein